jgi:hypothetical protein
MQNVRFKNVEDCIDQLPEQEREITEALRQLIFDCIPAVSEKLSYNVPFYRMHRSICYLWPGAVLWGQHRSYEGVELGFHRGDLLTDPDQILEQGTRKQVYYVRFTRLREIPFDALRSYFYEAALIDAEWGSPRKK